MINLQLKSKMYKPLKSVVNKEDILSWNDKKFKIVDSGVRKTSILCIFTEECYPNKIKVTIQIINEIRSSFKLFKIRQQ